MVEEKKKKKEKKEAKIVLERVYNIPLRKEFQKAPKNAKTKKAVSAVRKFVLKHMKTKNVKLGKYLNLELWKHGIRNPPHHIKVNCVKDETGLVKAEIVGAPKEEKKEPKKKIVKKKEPEEKKIEEVKDEKKEKAREIEKEELKEIRKEKPKVHAPKQAPQPKTVEQRPTAPMQKG